MSIVNQPLPTFFEKTGEPLDQGYIYIGLEDQNPETSPKAVYWDEALTIPAVQPLRTLGGYIVRNGSPARVYTNGQFSQTVRDRKSQLVYTQAKGDVLSDYGAAAALRADLLSTAAGKGQTLVSYPVTAQETAAGVTIVNAYWPPGDVRRYGATGNGSTDDSTAINRAIAWAKQLGGKVVFPRPPVRYKITSSIGTNQMVAGDLANNVELWFEPGTEVYYAPATPPVSGAAAIVLEGNNVKITGALRLTSDKTIVYASDPTPQRATYYTGIAIGGKGNRRLTPIIGYEKSGVLVEGATIVDFNLPLTVYGASNVLVRNNTVYRDTDTAILIDDCIAHIEVCGNVVYDSFDDCIYARHYRTTPWALAGWYIGDIKVHHNSCWNTFAKSIGFGGFSDVMCHDNYCANTWAAGINVEVNAPYWADNNKKIAIERNLIIDACRNFDPTNAALPAVQRAPFTDTTQQAGIVVTTNLDSYPANIFQDVVLAGNVIHNPGWNGVSLAYGKRMVVRDNYFTAGRVTKDGVNYDTGGSTVRADNIAGLSISGNTSQGDGSRNWPHTYEIVGDTYTADVKILYNPKENYGTALFVAMSAACAAAVSYDGQGLVGSASWAPGGITSGSSGQVDISVTGAAVGDMVSISYTQDLQGLAASGYVRTAGVVRAVIANNTGSTVTPAAGTLRATVSRRN